MRLELSWIHLGIRLTPVYASGSQRARPRFITPIRFNRSASGQGFPDVAAQGLNFQVVVGGKLYTTGSTSASAPVRLIHTSSHLSFSLTLIPPIRLSVLWSPERRPCCRRASVSRVLQPSMVICRRVQRSERHRWGSNSGCGMDG